MMDRGTCRFSFQK